MSTVASERLVEALRAALTENQRLKEQAARFSSHHDPVAIVGMGCRFPGNVNSPENMWDFVSAGMDAAGPLPRGRHWETWRPDPTGQADPLLVEAGCFLDNAADFDARFFGMTATEALVTDPQQRLLLEVAWQALEHARLDPGSLRGTATGVYFGAMYHDYLTLLMSMPDQEKEAAEYLFAGNLGSVLAGRVAYALGLEGPGITVDTACSSSLVALHLACQALRDGECTLALAGGTTVMATPLLFGSIGHIAGLARDGRSKSFAAGADGVAFGEGAGVLVLERLADAHRHGHRVLAVIRGSAVNQEGARNAMVVPGEEACRRLVHQALARADLGPADIDAVEGHGSGTPVVDPLEVKALMDTYGRHRTSEHPLWLGSVKSNLGHAQAAGGAAGIIKMVMALQHGTLPPTLHADEPTPHVDWSTGAVRLLTEPRDWPHRPDRPRRCAVSGIGIGGTNAHVILEEAPPAPEHVATTTAQLPLIPWAITAKTPNALRAQARGLAAHAERHRHLSALDLAYSLATTRSHFPHRALLLARHRDELLDATRALADNTPHPGVMIFPGDTWPPARLLPTLAGSALEEPCRSFAEGAQADWKAAFAGTGAHAVDLPTYAFQRQPYWPPAPAPHPSYDEASGVDQTC
ncbi:beta-ketoacyl synthase N-terminal-like domain-containing protein [Streptomyces sp. NPDC020883]|uniref:type I polyketide synthase n=1 Tax=Streptomyces sp. NPDC020883 TaxID=3365099 RepID=UPI0037BE1D5F